MSLSLMNLRITKQKTKELLSSLINRVNFFKLINFSKFCNSRFYEKIINKLKSKYFVLFSLNFNLIYRSSSAKSLFDDYQIKITFYYKSQIPELFDNSQNKLLNVLFSSFRLCIINSKKSWDAST